MSNLLEIENLSKSFGNKVVLRDVFFQCAVWIKLLDSLVTMGQGKSNKLFKNSTTIKFLKIVVQSKYLVKKI